MLVLDKSILIICFCLFNGVFCFENVAVTSKGATCVAINVHSSPYHCENAIDGSFVPELWLSKGGNVGIWMNITFASTYVLTYTRIHDRLDALQCIKELQMTFHGDVKINFQLKRCTGLKYNINHRLINEMSLPDIATRWVHIKVTEVYSGGNNGLLEAQFFIGKNPCPKEFYLVGKNCLYPGFPNLVTWQAAQDICSTLPVPSQLAVIDSQLTLDALTTWLNSVYKDSPGQSFGVNKFWTNGIKVDNEWYWGKKTDSPPNIPWGSTVPSSETTNDRIWVLPPRQGVKLSDTVHTSLAFALCEYFEDGKYDMI